MKKTMGDKVLFVDLRTHSELYALGMVSGVDINIQYRESIASDNAVAKKLAKLSDDQLFQDVRAYLLNNASDSDVANSCL